MKHIGSNLNYSQIAAVLEFDRFRFDVSRHILSRRDGTRVPLTHKACELLAILLSRPAQTITKPELFAALWPEGFVEDSNLTQTVYILRQTLGDANGAIIRTVPRRGYALVSPVRPYAPLNIQRLFLNAVPFAAIAAALLLELLSGLHTKADRTMLLPAPILKAYEVGRLAWANPTPESLLRSRTLFESVTRNAPSSPLGFAGLSDTYYSLSLTDNGPQSRVDRALAKQYALRALALDQSSSEAHLALARALSGTASDSEGEREFQSAISLDPRNPLAHRWYGFYCLRHARYGCATSELASANALDPRAWQNMYWLGVAHYYSRDFRGAIGALTEANRNQPRDPDAQLLLSFAWDELGRSRESDVLLQQLAAQHYDAAELTAIRAFNHARHGFKDQAAREIAPILLMPASKVPGAITIAGTLAELGQVQKARWWLRTRYAPDDASIYPLNDPRLDGVRQNLFGKPNNKVR